MSLASGNVCASSLRHRAARDFACRFRRYTSQPITTPPTASATRSQIHQVLDSLELLGASVEAGAVGTVVVVVAGAVEVGADPGTTMIAGRVVADWATVVDEGGGLVVGLVGDGAAVVGSGRVVRAGDGGAVVGLVVGVVVGSGRVVRSDAAGRVSVVVGAATVSVVVEGPVATVEPVVMGASGRGADGLELPELHAASAAVPSTTTVSQRVHARRDGAS